MDIEKYLNHFKQKELPRLRKLYRYYINDVTPPSLNKGDNKPSNKIKSNFCRSIVSNTTGYYMATPITYQTEDADLQNEIEKITTYNDDDAVNMSLAEDRSIFGVSYELVWNDEDKRPRYSVLSPLNTIPIFDNALEPNLIACIYFYEVEDIENDTTTEYVNLYDNKSVYEYQRINGQLFLLNETPHYFGDVPVVQYLNNKYLRGDFEDVLSLQDSYNILQSESINDFQTFADAYLYISGMMIDDDDVDKLRERRIITGDGTAQWLVKNTNDAHIQNMKNNAREDIFATSLTANFSDESFGNNLSGQALKYKIMNMENRVGVTQKFTEKGLLRRWELICNYLNVKGGNYDFSTIKFKFVRNLPANLAETATIATQLQTLVSQRSLLGQIPFIDDVEDEMKRIEDEQGNYTDFDENEEEKEDNEE